MKQCGTCYHFQRNPQDLKIGQCRRYPPNAFPMQQGPRGPVQFMTDFTPVQADWNCGEWQMKLTVDLGKASTSDLKPLDASQVNGGSPN